MNTVNIDYAKLIDNNNILVVFENSYVTVVCVKDLIERFNYKNLEELNYLRKNFQYDKNSIWWDPYTDVFTKQIIEIGVPYEVWRSKMNGYKEICTYFGTKVYFDFNKELSGDKVYLYATSFGGDRYSHIEINRNNGAIVKSDGNIHEIDLEVIEEWFEENYDEILYEYDNCDRDSKPIYIGWSGWDQFSD